MKEHIGTFLKGFAMGAANVVPGVSGGTIALITGIYERLIDALKAFDVEAVKLGLSFKIGALWKKVDGTFLAALMLGVAFSIVSLAKILEKQLEQNPVIVMSIFFGLIAASIPSVGKTVKKWSPDVIVVFLIGVVIAVSMAFLTPASERTDMFYLGLCGVAAMCSMIIPGLSGSFVLLLMGNYRLVLASVNDLTSGELGRALSVIIPVGIGAVMGLLVLSRFLSWLFKAHHDRAIGSITGFVVGSLVIIWPWKDTVTQTIMKKGVEEEKIIGYENWGLPNFGSSEAWVQLGAVVVGVVLILAIEFFANRNQKA